MTELPENTMSDPPEQARKEIADLAGKILGEGDEILNDYVQLDIYKRWLKRELVEVQEQLTAKTEAILQHMERRAISKITIDGITLSPKTSLYPKDDKDRTVTRWRLYGQTTGRVSGLLYIDQMWDSENQARLARIHLFSLSDLEDSESLHITEITIRASVAAMLSREDTAWLVNPSYNHRTLAAWIEELPKDEKTQLPIMPDHLKGLIDVSEVYTVASRKA